MGALFKNSYIPIYDPPTEQPAPSVKSKHCPSHVFSLPNAFLSSPTSSSLISTFSSFPSSPLAPNLGLNSQPSNKLRTLLSISARSVAQMSRSDGERSIADLITSRTKNLDLAVVNAGESLALEWVAEGDDSLECLLASISLRK